MFFGDFHSGKGWSAGDTNQLIKNFKRTPEEIRASPNSSKLQYYKDKAVSEVAAALRKIFSRASVAQRTFVPVSSSKTLGHPDYCDRLERTLREAFSGYGADIRPLLRQTVSTDADHRSGGGRSTYESLLEITAVDPAHIAPAVGRQVVLFDDVLTSGKHYRVAKTRILEVFPDRSVLGMFIARSIHRSPFDEFENLDA